jgi:FkbM family methyltransferase
MSFISYAQNFEDVMLWRALKHIQNGFYIDIGAQDPVNDSVSKAFYDHGWKGLLIEPVPEYAEILRKARPDEIVLEAALSDNESLIDLYIIKDTGLSSAMENYKNNANVTQQIQVQALTLKSVSASLVGKDVHWLKIDVEGFEKKVLKGWDSQILRPWVIVIESTNPNSPKTNYLDWDPIITSANYQFAYFDGLNRFYVANEHAELVAAFGVPPNIFDNFTVTANSQLSRHLNKKIKEIEVDRMARWKQIKTLTKMIKESEVDWAARGEQIKMLTKMVRESEADRAARGEQIEILTKMVRKSEADRAARGEQIKIPDE